MAEEATTGLAGSLIGTVLSGRYRLESKLGSGGMSTVFLARDETLERWVAVKVMHREISDQPDQIERFRREARTVAQLSHPNVVAVIDAGEDGGFPYIVFEYVEGETLKQRIDRLGRLPVDEAVAYAIEIGRGLAAAHSRRMVHRDVKPQNVLIDSDGRAKVTDFGIARTLEESDGLTKTGRVLGTTDYVAPEQAMGHGVDSRSDIYSLGVLLWEMLVGDVPFRAETVVGVAMKHVNEQLPDIQQARPETSSALAAVIERATSKEPSKRYEDMGAFLGDLEGALEVEVARSGGGTSGQATSVLDAVPSGRKLLTTRRISAAGIVLVLGAVTAALVIAALTGGGGKQTPNAVASGASIPLQSAQAFDPDGDPPNEEHNDAAKFAVDANPDTGWTTETYQGSPVLTKPGVGLVITTTEPVTARTMTIRAAAGGWDGRIYGSTIPPTVDSQTGEPVGQPIGLVNAANPEQTIQLNETKARYFLIWITKLSSTSIDGGYNVEIDDVTLNS
jgi:eukaryotic-like serine/threonine-protein kinase